jgi:hypothetical protein
MVRHTAISMRGLLRIQKKAGQMTRKQKKLHGTVQKIIKPLHSSQPEKAQIDVDEADDLYREIRVENEVISDAGQKARLKQGEKVDVIVEVDSKATSKSPK